MATRWEERDRGDYRDERRYENRDRGAVSRARDEVASWFGDDDAAERRRVDEARDERNYRDRPDRFGNAVERGWDRTREAVRHATDRDHDGRRGIAEWNDNDRHSRWGRPEQNRSYGEPGYGNYERGFGDIGRHSSADPYTSTQEWNRPTYAARDSQQQTYTGRGPRGYTRGDERIREDICERLTDDPRIDASDIEVQVEKAEVTLAGSVRTREEKHFTEHLVERITGVREVNNTLKVKPADEVLGTARSGASMLGLTDTPPPPTPPKTDASSRTK